MNKSFGPWSTALDTGSPQQLDTFWKRRLAMLPSLNQPESRVTRRTLLFIGVVALAALALPTLKWATHMQSAGTAGAFDVVEVEYLPRPSRFEEEFLAALEKPVQTDFVELALQDCLSYLQEYANIPFWFDTPALKEANISLDQPITLRFQGRLESVLHLLLKPAELEFLPENDVVVITTSTKAGENLITRTYPVRDLFHGRAATDVGSGPTRRDAPASPNANPDANRGQTPADGNPAEGKPAISAAQPVLKQGFGGGGGGFGASHAAPNDLVAALTTTIEPDSWDELSGPGSYTYVTEPGSLVIRQTWAIHRKILQLLRDLREARRMTVGTARALAVEVK